MRTQALILAAVLADRFGCLAQSTNVSVGPGADTFVWSQAPTNNYGAAGALSVSGSAATNALGQPNGLFDTLMRFPMAGVVAALNSQLGTNAWLVTGVSLSVNEVGAPPNSIFNRGVGAFEIRWIGSDAWLEGTGTPNVPTTNGVTYQDLPSLLGSATPVSLGQFTNRGLDGPLSFPLALPAPLLSNIVAGADLNLYVTATSASVGFTFYAREYLVASSRPSLVITGAARPVPVITSIARLGTNQVALRFNTVSNWTYSLQCADGLPAVTNGSWSTLFTAPAQATNGEALFIEPATNRQRCYRLSLSP